MFLVGFLGLSLLRVLPLVWGPLFLLEVEVVLGSGVGIASELGSGSACRKNKNASSSCRKRDAL